MSPSNEIHGLVSSRENSSLPQQRISASFPSWRSKMMSWGCGRLPTAKDERGLSTLEWILLVAAVGGLATMGVFIVRNATDATSEQVDGETDQVLVASQAEAEADALAILQEHNKHQGRNPSRYCNLGRREFTSRYFNSAGDYLGQDRPGATMTLLDKWGDVFYFSPAWRDLNGDGQVQRNTEFYCAAHPIN